MTPCVMCKVEFERKDLDYCGRCDACFYKFMQTPEHERPDMGVPGTKGYNSTWGKR